MKNKIKVIVENIENIIKESSRNTFIIGISGGIDSCLSLTIIHKYFPNAKIFAYYLPIENNANDLNSIKIIEKFLSIKIEIIDLFKLWNLTVEQFNIHDNMNANNIKSKLRNMFLYSMAFEKNGLVVSNLNYDEYYLGYFTKFADSNGDLYPLINLTKSDIYIISEYLNIPIEIINQKPTAGLYNNQFDEDEFKFSYIELDKYLNFNKIDYNIEELIKKRVKENKHKKTLDYLLFNNYRKD